MNLFRLSPFNEKNREPLILEIVRAVLFLIYFLISLYFSFNKNPLIFGITVGGMIVYALLIILYGVCFPEVVKKSDFLIETIYKGYISDNKHEGNVS